MLIIIINININYFLTIYIIYIFHGLKLISYTFNKSSKPAKLVYGKHLSE